MTLLLAFLSSSAAWGRTTFAANRLVSWVLNTPKYAFAAEPCRRFIKFDVITCIFNFEGILKPKTSRWSRPCCQEVTFAVFDGSSQVHVRKWLLDISYPNLFIPRRLVPYPYPSLTLTPTLILTPESYTDT